MSLIDGLTSGVLWLQRFMRTRSDMHSFQHVVTAQIACTLKRLKQAVSDRTAREAPRDLDAQDFALRRPGMP